MTRLEVIIRKVVRPIEKSTHIFAWTIFYFFVLILEMISKKHGSNFERQGQERQRDPISDGQDQEN